MTQEQVCPNCGVVSGKFCNQCGLKLGVALETVNLEIRGKNWVIRLLGVPAEHSEAIRDARRLDRVALRQTFIAAARL